MKNIFLIQTVILLLTVSCLTGQNYKLTSEEIWSKYLDSLGELDALLNSKTSSTVIAWESEIGKTIIKTRTKYPDKVTIEISNPNNTKSVVIVNGDSGIVKTIKGIETLSGNEMATYKLMALIHPEIHFTELGFKIELNGEENVNGKDYYNLKINKINESVSYLINKTNFQLFRIVKENSFMEILESNMIDNIRIVKQFKYCSGIKCKKVTLTEQKWNIVLDDKIFNLE